MDLFLAREGGGQGPLGLSVSTLVTVLYFFLRCGIRLLPHIPARLSSCRGTMFGYQTLPSVSCHVEKHVLTRARGIQLRTKHLGQTSIATVAYGHVQGDATEDRHVEALRNVLKVFRRAKQGVLFPRIRRAKMRHVEDHAENLA